MNTETQDEQQQDTTNEPIAVPSERVEISAAELGDPDAMDGSDDQAEGEQGEAEESEEQEEGEQGEEEAKKDPARREADGLRGDLLDTRKDLRAARERIAELERQELERQAAASKAASRDYDAELAELDEKYDNGDIEDFKTFQKQREQIVADRASEAAVAAHVERTVKEAAERAKQTWAASVDAFLADEVNASFRDDQILATALSAAIQVEVANGVTDHQTILANASKAVNERFGIKDPDAGTPGDKVKADRQRRQAEATATGAAAAPSPTSGGGAGMRSQRGKGELSESTASNDWQNMSQAQRDEALGKPA